MQKITNDLLALAQNGDETAVAALIARMMPAIRKGAAAATAPGLDFEDAVQEGLIGLFEAMHRYDTAAGMAFASFAAACITHAQQDARRAAQMEPGNTEYQMNLRNLQDPGRTYRTQTTYAQPGGLMRWCWSMILLNLLCNCCCGGGWGWRFRM